MVIRKAIAAAVLAFGMSGGAATSADAQVLASLPTLSRPLASVGDAKPLPAWTLFCQRYAGECDVDRSEPTTIVLTPKTMGLIVSVNKRVNATIKPMTDMEHWGVADQWDIPTDGYGDCEDFQLLKRKLLVEAGLPRRAMRMTVVIDEKNEGHAVLTVRTDRGDIALDNKIDAVLPWSETGYVFVKRESQDEVGWVSLGRAVSPTVTARAR